MSNACCSGILESAGVSSLMPAACASMISLQPDLPIEKSEIVVVAVAHHSRRPGTGWIAWAILADGSLLIRAELDKDLLAKVHGPVSLFFAAGNNRNVAVKGVDD
ncbi:MAG: hypothetical protein IPI44_15055 [Sulfuritalea sp.]|nr:hypothetical protein [Sulfuritalea sp.]